MTVGCPLQLQTLVLLLISIAQPLALRPSPTSAFFPALLMVAAVAVVVVVVVVPSSVLLLYRQEEVLLEGVLAPCRTAMFSLHALSLRVACNISADGLPS